MFLSNSREEVAVLERENIKKAVCKTINTVCEISKKKQSECCSIFHQPKRPEALKRSAK